MKIAQKDRIINYIREFGSISSWEAYADLGITQLGARIDQLKKEGYEFKTEWESNINRYESYNTDLGGSYDNSKSR